MAAALILTNSAVSMPLLIGILMLMGIVTKNAILLVDFAVEMRNQGMDRFARRCSRRATSGRGPS